MEKKKIEESSQRNKDLTSQIIPRPRTNQAVPPSSQTPQNPEEFARILTAKLQAVIEERAKGEKERAKQKRLTEKLSQVGEKEPSEFKNLSILIKLLWLFDKI